MESVSFWVCVTLYSAWVGYAVDRLDRKLRKWAEKKAPDWVHPSPED